METVLGQNIQKLQNAVIVLIFTARITDRIDILEFLSNIPGNLISYYAGIKDLR